jgi:hypothetical protein
MSLIAIKGTPSIVWGSPNALGANAPMGAIVESARLTPKNGSPIEIEDNSGIAANLVILRDGFNGKISALYDGSKTWPVEGANVAFNVAWNGANANAMPFGEGAAASYANGIVTYYCSLISIEPSYQRKKELMVDLNLVYRPNVTP